MNCEWKIKHQSFLNWHETYAEGRHVISRMRNRIDFGCEPGKIITLTPAQTLHTPRKERSAVRRVNGIIRFEVSNLGIFLNGG